nr:MAG TPA: Neuromedin U [Caudoviricetes sp.]
MYFLYRKKQIHGFFVFRPHRVIQTGRLKP